MSTCVTRSSSSAPTPLDLSVDDEWHFSRVTAEAGAAALGHAVREALDASNRIAAGELSDSGPFKPVLKAWGLRTCGQFTVGAREVAVDFEGEGDLDGLGVLRVTPTRNLGPRGGFEEAIDLTRIVDHSTADAVGSAVAEVMAQSEGW